MSQSARFTSVRWTRVRTAALAVALLTSGVGPGAAASEDGERHTLRMFTWSEYIDPDVVGEFEREFDAQVQFEYFESDEERDQRLSELGGDGFDIVLVNGVQLERHVQRRWIAPLESFDLHNIDAIEPRWRDAFAGAQTHGVAYFWGTLGIAWREDLWPAGLASWNDLLSPDAALDGRIAMTSDGRELIGIALKANGDSFNEPDRERIDAAGERLLAQAPSVSAYGYPELNAAHPLVAGEVVASLMYSGDALQLHAVQPAIRYSVPSEGGLLWVDYLTISTASDYKALAATFIDFLNRPSIAARQAQYLHYPSPNAQATRLLPASFRNDPLVYPDAAILEASEFTQTLPTRSRKRVNEIGARLLYR